MGIDREEVRRDSQPEGASGGGSQLGGGPTPSDMEAGGGSGSGGGYRHAQNQHHQGQDLPGYGSSPGQSRGERFDEAQGGGRSADSVSDAEEFAEDQQEHQDRGQRWIEEEREAD